MWWDDLLHTMQRRFRDMNADSLATTLVALHKLGVQPPLEWVDEWATAAQERLCLLAADQLHLTLVCLAAQGYTPTPRCVRASEVLCVCVTMCASV